MRIKQGRRHGLTLTLFVAVSQTPEKEGWEATEEISEVKTFFRIEFSDFGLCFFFLMNGDCPSLSFVVVAFIVMLAFI